MPRSAHERLMHASVLALATVAAAGRVASSSESAARAAEAPSGTAPAETKHPEGTSYGCPMHPDMRSSAPGKCPLCGMDLLPMGAPGGPPYRVALELSSRPIRPGVPLRLVFRITHPRTGESVTALQIVHERPFHLFLVSEDLEDYQHLHPEPTSGGTFEVDATPHRPGGYHVFCDFLPVGGTPQVVHLHEGSGRDDRPPVPHAADTKLEKVVDGVRFQLSFEPS